MDFGTTHKRSRGVAEASAKGVHYLMKKNKITEIDGWGTIKGANEVEVDKDGNKHVLHVRQPDHRHRREGPDAARA